MTYRAQYCLLGKEIPQPVGSGHASAVPIRAFKARDGKYLTIDAAQDKFFQNVCQALEIPETGKDPRFSTVAARLKNRDALFQILEKRVPQKDRDLWVELLIKADVPVGPVNDVAQALLDPSVLARKMVVPVEHLGEEIKMLGNPIKMSEMGKRSSRALPPWASIRIRSCPRTSGTPKNGSRV